MISRASFGLLREGMGLFEQYLRYRVEVGGIYRANEQGICLGWPLSPLMDSGSDLDITFLVGIVFALVSPAPPGISWRPLSCDGARQRPAGD